MSLDDARAALIAVLLAVLAPRPYFALERTFLACPVCAGNGILPTRGMHRVGCFWRPAKGESNATN